MCTGIALAACEVPTELTDRLATRRYDRLGVPEYQFHWWHSPTQLPVIWEGRVRLVRWGSKDRRGRLPYGGWVSEDQLGLMRDACPEPVVIPANLGHDKGTWFVITAGVRGVILPEVPGGPVVYMLIRPATNYYRNMTEQQPTMPMFVDQVI